MVEETLRTKKNGIIHFVHRLALVGMWWTHRRIWCGHSASTCQCSCTIHRVFHIHNILVRSGSSFATPLGEKKIFCSEFKNLRIKGKMNFLFSDDADQHEVKMWSIVGTVLVWASLWFLLELWLAHLTKRFQVLTHFALLAVGIFILHRVSKRGL